MPRPIAHYTAALLNETRGESSQDLALYRMFLQSERYVIDFAPDFNTDGWSQFYTDQDAHYFGVWYCPSKRMVLTYCEGDWSLEVGETADDMGRMFAVLCQVYREGKIATGYGPEGVTIYRQDRAEMAAAIA